jgi:hypothetical protein
VRFDVSKQIKQAQGPQREDCVLIVMRKTAVDAPWTFLAGDVNKDGTPGETSESVAVDEQVRLHNVHNQTTVLAESSL